MGRDSDRGDGTGGTGAGESSRAAGLVEEIRANALLIAAAQSDQLRLVAEFAGVVTVQAVAELGLLGRVSGAPQDHEVIDSAVVGELQAVLGIAAGPAARLVDLAERVTTVLPAVNSALAAGRLDLTRVRVLAEATEVLPEGLARQVAELCWVRRGLPRGRACRRGRGGPGWSGRWCGWMRTRPGGAGSRSTRRGRCARGPRSGGWPSCSSPRTRRMWRWPSRC